MASATDVPFALTEWLLPAATIMQSPRRGGVPPADAFAARVRDSQVNEPGMARQAGDGWERDQYRFYA